MSRPGGSAGRTIIVIGDSDESYDSSLERAAYTPASTPRKPVLNDDQRRLSSRRNAKALEEGINSQGRPAIDEGSSRHRAFVAKPPITGSPKPPTTTLLLSKEFTEGLPRLIPVCTYRCPVDGQPLYSVNRQKHTITIHATDGSKDYWPSLSDNGAIRHEDYENSAKSKVWKQKCGAGLAKALNFGDDSTPWELSAWPDGYRMFHRRDSEKVEGTYAYLTGSTFLESRKFKTYAEVTKHMLWLCTFGHIRKNCECKHCLAKFGAIPPRNAWIVRTPILSSREPIRAADSEITTTTSSSLWRGDILNAAKNTAVGTFKQWLTKKSSLFDIVPEERTDQSSSTEGSMTNGPPAAALSESSGKFTVPYVLVPVNKQPSKLGEPISLPDFYRHSGSKYSQGKAEELKAKKLDRVYSSKDKSERNVPLIDLVEAASDVDSSSADITKIVPRKRSRKLGDPSSPKKVHKVGDSRKPRPPAVPKQRVRRDLAETWPEDGTGADDGNYSEPGRRPKRAAAFNKVDYKDLPPEAVWNTFQQDQEEELDEDDYEGPYVHRSRESDIISLDAPFRHKEIVWYRLDEAIINDDNYLFRITHWPAVIVEKHLVTEAKAIGRANSYMNHGSESEAIFNPPPPTLAVVQTYKYELKLLNIDSKCKWIVDRQALVPWLAYKPAANLTANETLRKHITYVALTEIGLTYNDLFTVRFDITYTLWYRSYLLAWKAESFSTPMYQYLNSARVREMIRNAPHPVSARYKNAINIQKKLATKYFQALFWGNEKIWLGEIIRLAATWSVDDKGKQGTDTDDLRTGTRLKLLRPVGGANETYDDGTHYVPLEDVKIAFESLGRPVYFKIDNIYRREDDQLLKITGSFWEMIDDPEAKRHSSFWGAEDSDTPKISHTSDSDKGKARQLSYNPPNDRSDGGRFIYMPDPKRASLANDFDVMAEQELEVSVNAKYDLLAAYMRTGYVPGVPRGKIFAPVQVVNRPKSWTWTVPATLIAGRYYNYGTFDVNHSDHLQEGLAKALGGISKKRIKDTVTGPLHVSKRRMATMRMCTRAAALDTIEIWGRRHPELYNVMRIETPEKEESDEDDSESDAPYRDT